MAKFSEHTYIPREEIFSIHTKDGKVYENDYNKMQLLSGAYVSEGVVNPDEVDKNQMSLFAKGGSMPESSMYVKKRDIDYILIGEYEDNKKKIAGKNLYGGFWFDPKFAKQYPQYMKKKNAGGYLAIAQGVKGVAPKSVDKLDEKIAGQIDGTNRPMVFGMPVYEEGGVVFYDIYDDETNKTLQIKAHSLEEAEGIAETLDWDSEVDGNRIDVLDDIANYEAMEEYAKGGLTEKEKQALRKSGYTEREIYLADKRDKRGSMYAKTKVNPMFNTYAKGGKVKAKKEINEGLKNLEEALAGASKKHKAQSKMVGQIQRGFDETFEKGGKVDTHIAETILLQLGGMNRLKMFTGAYNFGALPNGVSFRIKSRGYSLVNYVKITLTPADLYNVEYGRIHNNKYRVIEEEVGLYNDMLVRSFESATNMYLSFARGGSVENFDLMEEYEALSDQNKAIVNLLNLYNPKGRLPRPKQTLKQLNVDEQYMVRQWNVGLQNQVSEELVKKMWGLMYEHSTIKQDYVYNVNKGAGRFLMNAGSDTICQYDFGHNTHLMINDLGYLVDDEIVRSFAQRNASSKRDYSKKTSGVIGVVSPNELIHYLNTYNMNNRPASLMVLIAPLKDGKVVEGITEVKKNIVIKNAFGNGIDGQLVIKEM